MSHKRYLDPKKKHPLGDDFDEMNSIEGKFQGENERHNMGGNGEIQSLISNMMQGL